MDVRVRETLVSLNKEISTGSVSLWLQPVRRVATDCFRESMVFLPHNSFHSLLSPFGMSHSLVIFLTSLSCCFIGGFFQLFKWSVDRIGRSLVAVRVMASFSKEYFSHHFSWKYRVD